MAIDAVSTATTTLVTTKAAGAGKLLQQIQIVDANGDVIDTQDVYLDAGGDDAPPPAPVVQQPSALNALSQMLAAFDAAGDVLETDVAGPTADPAANARTLAGLAAERLRRDKQQLSAAEAAYAQTQRELQALFDRHGG